MKLIKITSVQDNMVQKSLNIPAAVCKELELKRGDRILWTLQDDKIVLQKISN